jgi:hypothetical protein
VDSADVSFAALPGETNHETVRAEPGGIRFVDTGATLTTRSCALVRPHEVFCAGIAETLIVETGDGADVIDATAAPITIAVGGPGDDTIVAAFASGGPGRDDVRGLAAAGQLRGGEDDDRIVAGSGGGSMFGGDGNDTLVGGAGADVVHGGEGPCSACPPLTVDHDVVRAGAGADVIHVEEGRDRLDGESGNDTYVVSARARGVAATISDSGGDAADAIAATCGPVRLAAPGRYAAPGGSVLFSGVRGRLACAVRAVPRVVGLSLVRARRALAAAGFKVGKVAYRRSPRRGVVLSQSHRRARVGSAVGLVVGARP